MRLTWEPVYDHRGVAAHGYQAVSYSLASPAASVYYLDHAFDGATTSAVVRRHDLGRVSLGLRAVWYDGGPQIAEEVTLGANPISGLTFNNTTATSSEVSFTTSTCTYGDYRIAPLSPFGTEPSEAVVIDEFNAPRDGACYFSHGITLGVDTPALSPEEIGYQVTVVATDPVTGDVHFDSEQLYPR